MSSAQMSPMSRPSALFVLAVALAMLALASSRLVVDNADYSIWITPDDAVVDTTPVTTLPGVSLNGGGTDVDESFEWLSLHANGGDFLVLRTSGSDGYNDYIYELSQGINKTLNSVTSILIKNRNGSHADEVLSYVRNAEAIFFAGGDQSKYVNEWYGTPLQSAVQARVDNQVSVGGTSAGLAILGTRVYSAEHDTVYSDESMENPYNWYISFANRFLKLPNFEEVITDTHFSARDRMGRALTFLARSKMDTKISTYRSLGVDEKTALLLDVSTGIATAVGSKRAFICSSPETPVQNPNKSLQFDGITCHRVSAVDRDTYDFVRRVGSGVSYPLSILNGRIVGQPYGP